MGKQVNNKKKKWIRLRHKLIRPILWLALAPYTYVKYGIQIKRFRPEKREPYLILLNHQTAFDQFFVGISFRDPVYYLASEDLFSNGWVSSLIRYLVAPIPIKKQTIDLKAIMTCIRVSKEGGTIAIAPEGNRTYSGRTEYMGEAIATFARKLGMPIALYRIEGGYGVHPRWSDVVRKGKMRAYVSRVITVDEYSKLSDDELFAIIKQGLYVDEAVADYTYRHKKRAEYLERALYVCHFCGLSQFESHNERLTCKKCGRQVIYHENTELEGVGFDLPYRFVAQWYDAQADFINQLDVRTYDAEAMYCETVNVSEVIPYERKNLLLENVELSLYGNRLELKSGEALTAYSFDEISAITVLGKNKLNVYHGDKIYQIKGDKRFNALKYVHIYHRYKNLAKGNENGKFLGL